MKRTISLILAALMILTLASCGITKNTVPTSDSDASSASASSTYKGKVKTIATDNDMSIKGLKLSDGDFSLDSIKTTFAPGEKIEVSINTDFDLEENGTHVSVLCLKHRKMSEYKKNSYLSLGYKAVEEGFMIKTPDTDDNDPARLGEGTLTETGKYDLLIYNGFDLCCCVEITVK